MLHADACLSRTIDHSVAQSAEFHACRKIMLPTALHRLGSLFLFEYRWVLGDATPIQLPIPDRLRHMRGLDVLGMPQIRQRPRHPQDAMHGAC